MADTLPVRKYVKVWIKRRKNNARQNGNPTRLVGFCNLRFC